MDKQRYEAIKPGDVIVRRGESCIGYTRGNKYTVYGVDGMGLLQIKDDDGEGRPVGRMGFVCDDWHLYSAEWWDELQAGDKIMFRGYLGADVELPDYLTVGQVHVLYKVPNGNFYVSDDNDEQENVVSADFLIGNWVRVAPTEENEVKPGKAYEDLEVGDVLTYTPGDTPGKTLTAGKDYVVEDVSREGNVYVKLDHGDLGAIAPKSYKKGRWTYKGTSKQRDLTCRYVLPEDYWSLVDFALETGDKEWYDDLMKKAKYPV